MECVLADFAKTVGNGVDKRMLRMLCCVYELYNIKGFAYTRELSVLMGMDTRTVQKLISVMTDAHLLMKLSYKRKVAEVKPEVFGWTMTGYSLGIMQEVTSSYAGLVSDLKYGNNVVASRMRRQC